MGKESNSGEGTVASGGSLCGVGGSSRLSYKWVLVKTDNQSVVDLLKSRSSKNPMIMHMVRCIQFVLASFQFELQVEE